MIVEITLEENKEYITGYIKGLLVDVSNNIRKAQRFFCMEDIAKSLGDYLYRYKYESSEIKKDGCMEIDIKITHPTKIN